MAYIQPNTRVLLLTGVPLDETYEHTLYFANLNAQTSYFLGQRKYEFSPQTYQRKGVGYIKVNQRPELLYDCSYLMFQNTSYGSKWFYAFVLDVEYVNDVTAIISYQIDWLQTWWFELTIHECWIDREHIAVDGIGANLQDEGLEVGELEVRDVVHLMGGENELYIAVATTDETVFEQGQQLGYQYSAKLYTHERTVPSPLTIYCYEDPITIRTIMEQLALQGKIDGVVSMFLLPEDYVTNYRTMRQPWDDKDLGENFLTSLFYTPKNAKLYQYPYNIFEVTDCNSVSKVYKPELVPNQRVIARHGVTISPTSELFCFIKNYNNEFVQDSLRDEISSYDSGCVSSGLPQVAYDVDSYMVWLGQNSTWIGGHRIAGSEVIKPQQLIRDVSSAATVAGNVAASSGSARAGATAGAVKFLTDVGVQVLDGVSAKSRAELLPDKYVAGTGSVASVIQAYGFHIFHKCLRADYAKRIDDFFEMFGYKTNELKIPNTHSRPHWNYVKTRMANITGNIPSADLANIKAIFNNGITFWKHANEVGNYSLNNH